MKKYLQFTLLIVVFAIFQSFATIQETKKMRCLIQLTNYGGEGAYVATSLISPEGVYEKTLLVNGDDVEWYEDLADWYTYLDKSEEYIDGVTGASIQSGGRKVAVLEVATEKINAGYKIRFETAVEDEKYYSRDLEIELSEENFGKSLEGTGYIRYVKVIAN